MRYRNAVRLAKRELKAFNDAAKSSGGADALVHRSREVLGLDALEARSAEGLLSFEARLSARLDEFEAWLSARLDEFETRTRELAEGADRIDRSLADARDRLQSGIYDVERRMEREAMHALIQPVTEWVRKTEVASQPLISVVLATRNRSALLHRAVESVRAQLYPNFELVVVDDGSTDGTGDLVSDLARQDGRIVPVSRSRCGVSVARNAGLSVARGDIVCYADDDNLMQPLWLKGVAWAFERQPDTDVLYGARVLDVERSENGGVTGMPFLQFEPFDRAALESCNFIDLGVLAHRRNLREAIFDESMDALVDWDLILRLSADRPPLALPVVASHYNTTAPDRISRIQRSARFGQAVSAVRAKVLRNRPVRVLGYNALFPLVTETYVASEMRALSDNGAVVAWCTEHWLPSPVRVTEPIYTDLETAVAEFDPDITFSYWATFIEQQYEALTHAGKPFAARIHSFDFDPERIERIRSHPLCVGVWAYPHHAQLVDGAHDLVSLLTERDAFEEPAVEWAVVLSVSAALSKKDWPTLVGAFSELSRTGADCRIVVGTTYLNENEPDVVTELITAEQAQVMLSINVSHDQVLALLARTVVVVFTMRPGIPIGMPRSIIEGMYAGASVVVSDRPEVRFTAGPHCRTYRTGADIVRHVNEILAGGAQIEAERRANRAFVERHFADPSLASAFADDVFKALAEFRDR